MRVPGRSGCPVLSGQTVHGIALGRSQQDGRGTGLLPPLQPPAQAALRVRRTLGKAVPQTVVWGGNRGEKHMGTEPPLCASPSQELFFFFFFSPLLLLLAIPLRSLTLDRECL